MLVSTILPAAKNASKGAVLGLMRMHMQRIPPLPSDPAKQMPERDPAAGPLNDWRCRPEKLNLKVTAWTAPLLPGSVQIIGQVSSLEPKEQTCIPGDREPGG